MSNSTRVAGYSATIDAGGILSPPAPRHSEQLFPVVDLSGTLAAGFALVAYEPETGKVRVGFLSTFIGEIAIPQGDTRLVLEIRVCLEPGTPAGVHPITIEEGELADYDTARRIPPQLVSGSITVLETVEGSECVLDEDLDPQRPDLMDVEFKLADAAGSPGGEVTVRSA